MDHAQPVAADDEVGSLTPAAASADPLLAPVSAPLGGGGGGGGRLDSPSDLVFDVDALLLLARRGQWRSLLDAVALARQRHRPHLLPHHHLTYLSLSVLALHKLRRFSDAAAELDSAALHDLPSFEASRFRFGSYESAYDRTGAAGTDGSMLPFVLRFLHADLPQRLGHRPVSLDRLYALLDFVRSKIQVATTEAAIEQWRRREAFLASALCCNHVAHREFEVALSLIRQLLERDPSDPVLLSRLGYIQLQIGDLGGARASFALAADSVHKLDGEKEAAVEMQNLVSRNKALESIVAKDYSAAVREYEECIERDPTDVVAVNNKALCLMYSRDLSDSIKVLEGALERVPTVALNETLVMNLCSMYELAYVNHGEIKKSLSNWIARVACDDFDSSCTRI